MNTNVSFNSKLLQFTKRSLVTALVAATASSAYSFDFNASQGTSTAYLAQTNLVDNQFSINLSVNDDDSIPGMWVVLKSPQAGDVLSFTELHGVTGVFETDNNDAYILKLSGIATAAQYQEIARTVSLTSSVSGAREVNFVFDDNDPDTLYNIYNNHYYLYVRPQGYDADGVDNINITWQEANIDANTKTYYGLQGYLVTIGDDHENTFVYSKIDDNTWMGATDDPATVNALTGLTTVEDHWYWVTGPEKGTQFWQGKSVTHTGSEQGFPVNGLYSNWDEVDDQEPNNYQNYDESFAHFFAKDENLGNWNDVPNLSSYYKVKGYLVEFGGLQTDTNALVSTKQIIVETNQAPTISVTLGSQIVEGSASEDQVVASFTASDIEDASAPVINFASGTNSNNYYSKSGSNILLTQAGADFVNAGGILPAITLSATDSDGSSTDSTPVTPMSDSVNDAPVISLVLGADVAEHSAMDYQVVATFSATDEEDGTPAITFESNSNTSAYYEILGSNVVLSPLGAAAVNAGNALPEIQLTATDSQNSATNSIAVTPVTTLINDAPVVSITLGTNIEEGSASNNQVVASFVATDEEDGTPAVTFTANTDMYYTITGSDVVLTQAGADIVNAGGTLPSITLIATDSDSESVSSNSVTPVTTSTNDAPEITLTLGSDVVENSASKDQVVASFVATDEEDGTPAVTFAANTDMYYTITGSDVVLTQAGADVVNAGGTLPSIELIATDSDSETTTSNSVTPITVLANAAPVVTVTLGSSIDEISSKDQVIASFVASDEEDSDSPTVEFMTGTNTNGYYAISSMNIVLTQAGADFVNAGGSLPAISLTATDSDNAKTNSTPMTPIMGDFIDTDEDGILDSIEGQGDADDDSIPNYLDTDSDNDGISDKDETDGDSDNDGVPNYLDTDSDNDGVTDELEGNVDTDNDGVPNYLDQDSDNDGIPDSVENNLLFIDEDLDGITDQIDVDYATGDDANNDGRIDDITLPDTDSDGIADYLDNDTDNDGLTDSFESGLVDSNNDLIDSDNDGIADYFDVSNTLGMDLNNDGIDDAINPLDTDQDGIANYRDLDSDNDSILDLHESVADLTELDANEDGIIDQDSTIKLIESPIDTDMDGSADFIEVDSNNDGEFDISDTPNASLDTDNTGSVNSTTDNDQDGIMDEVDADPTVFGSSADQDGDGIPNNIDPDDDNDGISDIKEGEGDDDNDGLPNRLDTDSNNDGILDQVEAGLPEPTGSDQDQDGIDDAYDADMPGAIDTDQDGFAEFPTSPAPAPALDSDNDGIPDSQEGYNLPPLGSDADSDGIDDRYDVDQTGGTDENNDGIDDDLVANNDVDGDGTPNYLDEDSDGDGYSDSIENGDYNNDGISDYLQAEESLTTGVRGAGSVSIWFMLGLMLIVGLARFKSVRLIVMTLTMLGAGVQALAQDENVEPYSVCQNQDSTIQSDEMLNCVYGGLGLGFSLLYPNDDNSNWKAQTHASSAINAQIGWRFSPRLFTELNFHWLGKSNIEHINPSITNEESIGYSALSMQLGGYLFDSQKEQDMQFNPFAKVGLAKLFTSASDDNVPVEQLNDFQLALAVGVQKQINKHWFVRTQWEGFDKDAKSISVSVHRYIGSKATQVVHPVQPEPVEEVAALEPVKEIESAPEVSPELAKNYCSSVPADMKVDSDGCPILYDTIVSIYFDFDSDQLNDEAKKVADKVVIFMKSNPDYIFEIQGNTDAQGSLEYNKALSLRRAENTLAYLVAQGIDENRLNVIAYGESLAVESDQTYTQQQQRRADFVILKK